MKPNNRFFRRAAYRTSQQMFNIIIQEPFFFKVFIDLRLCKCGITTKALLSFIVFIPLYDRFQQLFPVAALMTGSTDKR